MGTVVGTVDATVMFAVAGVVVVDVLVILAGIVVPTVPLVVLIMFPTRHNTVSIAPQPTALLDSM